MIERLGRACVFRIRNCQGVVQHRVWIRTVGRLEEMIRIVTACWCKKIVTACWCKKVVTWWLPLISYCRLRGKTDPSREDIKYVRGVAETDILVNSDERPVVDITLEDYRAHLVLSFRDVIGRYSPESYLTCQSCNNDDHFV